MWRHFALALCCFTVAVTASERSPAKVRIHHKRSTQAELIASVEALGKTHHLKLKRTSMPSVRLHELVVDANGTVTIHEVGDNQTRNYYEDEKSGALLFMNDKNTLEGMVSDSVALHYDNNEHTVTEVNEKTATPFCDVSGNSKFHEELPKDDGSYSQQAEKQAISYVVEALALADSTLANYKGTGLVDYLRVYWKMVDRRFRTVSPASISIRLTNILYCSTTACDNQLMDARDLSYADLDSSLSKFAIFLKGYRSQISPFDVGHLITRRNLFRPSGSSRNTDFTGIAFVGTPCYMNSTHALNTGISEDDGLWAGTFTTAHEIGHNLGAPHDGEGTSSTCSSNMGYLMSYVRINYRSLWFSPCSSAAMVNTYCTSYAGCLRTIDDPTYETYPNYIAGNYRDLNTQCQWATKVSTAIANPSVSANDQCFLLRCRYVIGTTTWYYSSGSPALDGTPCSTGGFCKDGYCQASWM